MDGARREALAARLRQRLGPPPEREQWPLISAIVPTRNGLHHLERLFAGLIEHTSYPALEVVVIDNASSDGTLDYLRSLDTHSLDTPFPVSLLASDENLSFAEANARGAQQARGELLLFLNNDVEPFESGWLKELVCALDSEGVEAVGATLLHPEDSSLPAEAPPLVQHRAIRFRWQDEMVKGFNHGDGEELWEGSFGTDSRAPAVTAACMLIARDSFERVGGFGGAYRYGTEDVDLGLKLLVGGGESAGAGRSVLYPPRVLHPEPRLPATFAASIASKTGASSWSAGGRRWRASIASPACAAIPSGLMAPAPHLAITLTSLDAGRRLGGLVLRARDRRRAGGARLARHLRRAQGRALVSAARGSRLRALADGPLRPAPRARRTSSRSPGSATGPSAGWSAPGSSAPTCCSPPRRAPRS